MYKLIKNGCHGECMDELMIKGHYEWMNEWMNGSMNELMLVWLNKWINDSMNERHLQ